MAGEALEPTPTATTVRVRDGQTLTTDGPFAETKEALGGYYLVEAKDLDEAIEIRGGDPGRGVRLDRGPADPGAPRGIRHADRCGLGLGELSVR